MRAEFIVSKDKPEVEHEMTNIVWVFRRETEDDWIGTVINMDERWRIPADHLADMCGQARDAFVREWKL